MIITKSYIKKYVSIKGDSTMGIEQAKGPSFMNFNYFNNLKKSGEVATTATTTSTAVSEAPKTVEVVKNVVAREDLASNIETISNKAKINTPEAQGLATAQEVENGELVSGFHFDTLGKYDAKTFAFHYNSANTPRIASGTNTACEGIEYTEVAGHLQSKENPYADLFA